VSFVWHTITWSPEVTISPDSPAASILPSWSAMPTCVRAGGLPTGTDVSQISRALASGSTLPAGAAELEVAAADAAVVAAGAAVVAAGAAGAAAGASVVVAGGEIAAVAGSAREAREASEVSELGAATVRKVIEEQASVQAYVWSMVALQKREAARLI
jgi:hypothetical protein